MSCMMRPSHAAAGCLGRMLLLREAIGPVARPVVPSRTPVFLLYMPLGAIEQCELALAVWELASEYRVKRMSGVQNSSHVSEGGWQARARSSNWPSLLYHDRRTRSPQCLCATGKHQAPAALVEHCLGGPRIVAYRIVCCLSLASLMYDTRLDIGADVDEHVLASL